MTPLLTERAPLEGPRSTGAVGVTGVPRLEMRSEKLNQRIGGLAVGVPA